MRLTRASRIEIVLDGDARPEGLHAELHLPPAFRQRTFHQQQYVQTPGRVVDGTKGWWRALEGGSTWSLGFTPAGRATVDQLEDAGTVVLSLQRFQLEIARREVELGADGGTMRVQFTVPAAPAGLAGSVTDATGRPVAGVAIHLAPIGGRTLVTRTEGFPVWAPSTVSAADGSFRLPRPEAGSERIVFRKCGYGDRVLTIAELDAMAQQVPLEPGRAFVLEALDRNEKPMDGAWSTGGHDYPEPSVHLGHDVWRAASADDHPAAAGRRFAVPFFLFADLPAGIVTVRFRYLDPEDVLRHDTRIAAARFVAQDAEEELMIGK